MLVDLQRDGRTIKSLIHPGRDAIFWVLERKPDKINYVAGWPFVHTDVWKGIEAETGRPIVDPAHKPVIGKRVEFCPSLWGGKDWPSAAYSQKTSLVYVPANENFCGGFTGEKVPLVPGQLWLGTKPEDIGLKVRPGADHFGELQAWDPATGKKVWSAQLPQIATVRFGDRDRGRSRSSPAAPTTGCSAPSMPRPARCCGSRRPTPASWACRSPMRWMARNISPCSPAGASTRNASRTRSRPQNNVGIENNVPQGGVVWVFAVKK